MAKFIFDATVHLGQFSSDEKIRLACKAWQVAISTKPAKDAVGIITFNENSVVDDIIWGLDRETQDTFYKFMDLFHSVKQIERVPINKEDASLAIELASKLSIGMSQALTCAVAVSSKAGKIETLYQDLLRVEVVEYINFNYGISIVKAISNDSVYQESELELFYQDVLRILKDKKIDLLNLAWNSAKKI